MAVAYGVASRPSRPMVEWYAAAEIDKERLEERISHLCGLFVFINHSRIYLIHQTAKEFLIRTEAVTAKSGWKHCLKPIESETVMARICVEYLSLKDFESIVPHDVIEDEDIEDEYCKDELGVKALLRYAAEHWPYHVRKSAIGSESPDKEKLRDLYESDRNCFRLWFPLLWKSQLAYRPLADMDSIRLIGFNGHDVVFRHWIDKEGLNLDSRDNGGYTALQWAAEMGHEEVVRLLLEKGANINAQGGQWSPWR